MLVAIPSKGRAGKVRSQSLVPSGVLYVPENEAGSYEAAGGQNIVKVPNNVLGITRTRNWILNNTEENWVIFVDDDVRTAGWLEMGYDKAVRRPMNEQQLLKEWQRTFEITEDMNYRIWGCATISAPRAVYPYKPFLWQSYVTASMMGIRNETGIRFDESFPVKEDYEMCLRCIEEDGGVVAARYFYWENSHWGDEGGCKDYRTSRMEDECIARLIQMYPRRIRRVTRGGVDCSIELNF